ncbi:Alpha/Beta hydrolase protein [Gamsiella multidivaricata]|uniref:Alpha/Beta hydrolase protein n=1 Tax=Gamsiella multidivaricata TaxID=101098 RepID=UPI00222092C8|nr:Alpha/Beta hydrolase protein [Gamsiella multidivaricata]KAI7832527.1 Alpha/Beta hydrolase protein [Gamsiella multidivaricata]
MIAGLAQQLSQEEDGQDDTFDVLVPLKLNGSLTPLFCIHLGLGLSRGYLGLSKHLHPEQRLYGLQARGIGGIGKMAETIEEMTQDYIDQIRHVQPHGPYHLLGWSFGGNVAHSMAVELEKAVGLNNSKLRSEYATSTYSGDMFFFRATAGFDDTGAVVDPEEWMPYVQGNIEAHGVECGHMEMDKPGPMADIGRAIAARFEKLQQ